MINRVRQYIKENKLLEKGDKVLVALSGGPDSVCLLHMLYMLKEEFKLELGAIHINHMLRGNESEADEEYTYKLCENLGIEYYVRRIDIDYIAKVKGVSIEVAGRDSRYEAFEEIKYQYGYNKIAVAHNANDQVETILMRMMRGTGLEGLTGIKPKRDGDIIRPILCLERELIERHCEDYKLEPRIDRTNNERIYSRNKVRLDIIPYMKENFNPDIIEVINRMAILLQKDNKCIEDNSQKCYDKYCKLEKSYIRISKELFENEDEAIVTRVIKIAFKRISNSYQNFEMKHIYEIVSLVKKPTGKQINLTNNIIAEKVYGDIVLKENVEKTISNNELEIQKEKLEGIYEFGEYLINIEVIKNDINIKNSKNCLIKLFNYDKIDRRVTIRYRRDGDKINPIGMKGNKKIKDIFIDMKIPREERDQVPIVEIDNNISWLVGLKTSDIYKIEKNTKEILKITFNKRGKNNEK